jgi:hypothetical protein
MKTSPQIKSWMLRPLAAAILVTGCSSAMVSGNGSVSQEPVPTSNLPLNTRLVQQSLRSRRQI